MTYQSRDSDILRALQAGDVLTPAIAHTRWGVLALHSAISRLRKQGHTIACKMVDGHGSYRLAGATKAAPQSAMALSVASPVVGQTPADAAPCYDRAGRLLCYATGYGNGRPVR